MTIKPIPYPNLPDLDQDLFGGNIFNSPTPKPDTDFSKPFELPKVQVSPAAQQAIKAMEDGQRSVEQSARMAQARLKQQQKQEQDYLAEAEKANRATAKLLASKKKAEEKAKKELEEALKKDSTTLIRADFEALINSQSYKNAGDLQKRDIANEFKSQIESRLRNSKIDTGAVSTSLRAFDRLIERDINDYKTANSESGVLDSIWATGKNVYHSVAKSYHDYKAGNETQEAGQITEAHKALRAGKSFRGWEVEELIERDPTIAQYLDKQGLFDSTATWSLKKTLTPAQRADFDKRASAAFSQAFDATSSRINSSRKHESLQSPEQIRELKNREYEMYLMRKKYEGDDSTSAGVAKLFESVAINAKYGATSLTEQAGSLAATTGSSLAAIGATAAAGATLGAAAPAAAASWANTLKNAQRVIGTLAAGATGAELTESDIINTVRDEILNAPIEKLRTAPEWRELLALSGGDEKVARQRLATVRSDDDVALAYATSFVLNAIGPEALLSRAISNRVLAQGVAQAGAGTTARSIGGAVAAGTASTLAEGVEEGFTQYQGNKTLVGLGIKDSLMDGVWEAAGAGIAVGGLVTGGATTINLPSTIANNKRAVAQAEVVGTFTDEAITARVASYQEQGKVDFNNFRQTVFQDFMGYANNLNTAFPKSPEQIHKMSQAYYDYFIDNDNVLSVLTPSQQKQLKEGLQASFHVNINPYRKAQQTASMQDLANEQAVPSDEQVADVWRVLHGVAGVQNERVTTVLAQLYATADQGHGSETVRERARRINAELASVIADTPNLSSDDITAINRFVFTHYDANFERESDNETQKQDQEPPSPERDSTDTPTAEAGADANPTEPTQAEPNAGDQGQAPADTQSGGGSGAGQGATAESTTEPTSETGASPDADSAGTTEVSPTGQKEKPTTETGDAGAETAQTGDTGNAPTTKQQPESTTPQSKKTPRSSGKSGTTPPKRSANGKRPKSATQEVIARAVEVYAEQAPATYEALKDVVQTQELNNSVQAVAKFIHDTWTKKVGHAVIDVVADEHGIDADRAKTAFDEIRELTYQELEKAKDETQTSRQPVDSGQPTTGGKDESSDTGGNDSGPTTKSQGQVPDANPENAGTESQKPKVKRGGRKKTTTEPTAETASEPKPKRSGRKKTTTEPTAETASEPKPKRGGRKKTTTEPTAETASEPKPKRSGRKKTTVPKDTVTTKTAEPKSFWEQAVHVNMTPEQREEIKQLVESTQPDTAAYVRRVADSENLTLVPYKDTIEKLWKTFGRGADKDTALLFRKLMENIEQYNPNLLVNLAQSDFEGDSSLLGYYRRAFNFVGFNMSYFALKNHYIHPSIVMVHELLHAVTSSNIESSEFENERAVLSIFRGAISQIKLNRLKDKGEPRSELEAMWQGLTPHQRGIVEYALANEHEIVAVLFSENKAVRDFMAKAFEFSDTEKAFLKAYAEGSDNIFTAFIKAFKKLLGINDSEFTALYKAVDNLIKKTPDPRQLQAPANLRQSVSDVKDAIYKNYAVAYVYDLAHKKDNALDVSKHIDAGEVKELRKYISDYSLNLSVDKFVEQQLADNLFHHSSNSLPDKIRHILNKIWQSLKKSVAAVSMALAITGTTFGLATDAQAATFDNMSHQANQVAEYVQQTKDNQGKPYIIADKRAGTLTLFSAQGVQLSQTPALFGKTVGDSNTSKNTPAGRYSTQNAKVLSKGYGGSAQALNLNGKEVRRGGGAFAIHRVLDIENRPARLSSKTLTDNRISHGCINVPVTFYNQHLDGEFNGVVYVLPETGEAKDFFIDGATAPAPTETTKETVTEPVKETPKQTQQTFVEVPNVSPIIITPAQKAPKPQAEAEPTPAQSVPTKAFDTHPIEQTTDDGVSVFDIVVGIMGALGFGAGVRRLRKGKVNATTTNATTGGTTPAGGANTGASDTGGIDDVFTAGMSQSALARAVRKALDEQIGETASTQAAWLRFILDTQGDPMAEFVNGVSFIQAGIDDALSDSSVAQHNVQMGQHWFWDRNRVKGAGDSSKSRWRGVGQFYAKHMAGISPRFDDFMNALKDGKGNYIVPRTNIAQDSNVLSVALGKIRASTNGVYATMDKHFIQPVIDNLRENTFKYADKDYTKDAGHYANMRHILDEGAEQFIGEFFKRADVYKEVNDAVYEQLLDLLEVTVRPHQEDVSEVLRHGKIREIQDLFASYGSTKVYDETKEFKELLAKWQKLHKSFLLELTRGETTRQLYHGELEWEEFPKYTLLGGMTKEQLEDEIARLESIYDKADLEATSDLMYKGIHGIRQVGEAMGLYSPAEVEHFNNIGFSKYVPLHYSKDNDTEATEILIEESEWEQRFAEYSSEEVRSLGLAKDLSKYRRGGSHQGTRPDDAFTNMAAFARNISARAAQTDFASQLQRLFEGTIKQPIGEVPSLDFITDINKQPIQRSAIPGLVRIEASRSRAILRNTALKDVLPIPAKGWGVDRHGKPVEILFHYYFEDTALQNELTHTVETNSRLQKNVFVSNARTIMRWQARNMTSFRPMWNAWNFAREAFERSTTLMFRPAVDTKGKRVSRLALAGSFHKNLAKLTSSTKAHDQVARYILHKEVKTPLQRMLRDLHQAGTINLYTDVSEKYDLLGKAEKSHLENLGDTAKKYVQKLASKSHKAVEGLDSVDKAIETYIARVVETPQTLNALAMYMAYIDNDVNSAEAKHRVRDAFDPIRSQSNFLHGLSALFPFVRSTGAGHYNTWRTFGDAYRDFKNGNSGALLSLLAMTAIGVTILALASGALGDDEDGEPILPYLPTEELQRGVPVKMGDSLVYLPVGHGVPSMVWGTSVLVFKGLNGSIGGGEVSGNLLSLFLKNAYPATQPTVQGLTEDTGKTLMLMASPAVILPLVEASINKTLYGNGQIVYQPTPRGEKDSEQDTFHTPEAYKAMARTFDKVGIDVRPENIRHVLNNTFGVGPLRAVDASLQDKGTKTAGVFVNKGEDFGGLATMIGFDMGVSPSALSYEQASYRMRNARWDILDKYKVKGKLKKGEKTDEPLPVPLVDFSEHKAKSSAFRIASDLYEKGASTNEIQFVVNTLAFENQRKALNQKLRLLSNSHYRQQEMQDGTIASRAEVRDTALDLLDAYALYVKANNHYYREFLHK